MDETGFTRHARVRLQQRAIPYEAVDIVVGFGRMRRHGRADVFSLDRRARKAVRDDLGENAYRDIEPRLDIYVVMGRDGRVVTVAHRTERMRNA